jgi:hypothetical protein
MAPTVALSHTLPPLGAKVAITDPAAPPTFVAPVDIHLGRYFWAGAYRFHVTDDLWRCAPRPTWKLNGVFAELLSPEDAAALPPF